MVRTIAAILAVGALQLPPATFTDTAVTEFLTRVDPRFVYYHTLYKQPIDDRHFLLLVRAAREPITWFGQNGELPWGHDELLGVFLMDRRDSSRVSEILVLTDHTPLGKLGPLGRYERVLRVDRAEATTLVLDQTEIDHWGRVDSIKLFLDTSSKRLIARVDFPPVNFARILHGGDRLCAALTTNRGDIRTGETPARQVCIERGVPVDRGAMVLQRADPTEPPSDLPPLPQSSYDDFAQARPERVRNGYRRAGTTIEERASGWQRVANRIWFGRSFYDGEGMAGVGDLGYFDSAARAFTFLKIPELAPWSTSALLVDGNVAWIGLVGQYELATKSGGLLRVDVRTRRTRRYDVPPVIHEIVRWNGALYLATADGLYALRDDRLTRYRFEPDVKGELAIVTQTR